MFDFTLTTKRVAVAATALGLLLGAVAAFAHGCAP